MYEGMFVQVQHAALVAWQKQFEQQMGRALAMAGRVADVETKAQLRAHDAIDEWSRLMKETLAYQAELSAEWRKLSVDSMQKLGIFMPAPVPGVGSTGPSNQSA